MIEKIQKGIYAIQEKGYRATDVVFKYPKDDNLILGEHIIKCIRGKWDTGHTIFGMKIWVDETIKDECFYLLDINQMIRSERKVIM